MTLDLELFSLLRIAGQTRSSELMQMADTNQHYINTLRAHAMLLLRSNAVLELASGKFDPDPFVSSFLKLYGHTADEDTRNGMLEDVKTLARITPSGIDLGHVNNRFVDGLKILHVPPTMTSIDGSFCSYYMGNDPDLTPLSHVTSIDNCFFLSSNRLTKIDLTPFRLVASIGGWFLYNCCLLERIDLTPLAGIVTIPSWFLSKCNNLIEVDFTPLTHLRRIGSVCLNDCHHLKKVKFASETQIAYIGEQFLANSMSLMDINIDALRNVMVIENGFLYHSPICRIVDLSPVRHALQ